MQDNPAQPTPSPSVPPSTAIGILPIAVLVCAALVVIGSFGPWATALGGLVKKNGVDGDGMMTLLLGLVAGIAALMPVIQRGQRLWLYWVAAAAFLVSAAIAVYDWNDVSGAGAGVSVGWGLPVTALSSIAGAGLAVWHRLGGRVQSRQASTFVPRSQR